MEDWKLSNRGFVDCREHHERLIESDGRERTPKGPEAMKNMDLCEFAEKMEIGELEIQEERGGRVRPAVGVRLSDQ